MNTSQPVPTLVASALKVFAASLKSDAALYQANQSLIQDVVRAMLQQIEVILQKGDREDVKEVARLGSFVGALDTLGGDVFNDGDLASVRHFYFLYSIE